MVEHPVRVAFGLFLMITVVVAMTRPESPWDIKDRPMPFTRLWYTGVYVFAVITAIATWMVTSR